MWITIGKTQHLAFLLQETEDRIYVKWLSDNKKEWISRNSFKDMVPDADMNKQSRRHPTKILSPSKFSNSSVPYEEKNLETQANNTKTKATRVKVSRPRWAKRQQQKVMQVAVSDKVLPDQLIAVASSSDDEFDQFDMEKQEKKKNNDTSTKIAVVQNSGGEKDQIPNDNGENDQHESVVNNEQQSEESDLEGDIYENQPVNKTTTTQRDNRNNDEDDYDDESDSNKKMPAKKIALKDKQKNDDEESDSDKKMPAKKTAEKDKEAGVANGDAHDGEEFNNQQPEVDQNAEGATDGDGTTLPPGESSTDDESSDEDFHSSDATSSLDNDEDDDDEDALTRDLDYTDDDDDEAGGRQRLEMVKVGGVFQKVKLIA